MDSVDPFFCDPFFGEPFYHVLFLAAAADHAEIIWRIRKAEDVEGYLFIQIMVVGDQYNISFVINIKRLDSLAWLEIRRELT